MKSQNYWSYVYIFPFQDQYYLQIYGAAMGSLVFPIVCKLYYVTHTVLLKAHAQGFTDHLNSIDDSIKLTKGGEVIAHKPGDKEENTITKSQRALAFFSVGGYCNVDGSIKTKVYCKEYLLFSSNHPLGL